MIMAASVPIRGTFVLVGTDEMYEFMFNPSTVSDDVGANYASQEVPGVSFPTQSYAGGRARTVSFELFLFERGIRRFRPANAVDTRVIQSTDPRNELDLTDDIKFLQSLTQPQSNYQEGRAFEARAPAVLLLNLGPMYQGWPCVVTQVGSRISKFSPNLEPVEVTVSISLTHKPPFSETRSNYFVRRA